MPRSASSVRVVPPRAAAPSTDAPDVPVFIVSRDQVTWLRMLVGWLERHGTAEIVIVDNASTYPPLLEYLETTAHQVVRLDDNLGPQAPWASGSVERLAAGRPYIVTDPDIVPTEECPADAIATLLRVLARHPAHVKAGLGLRIDDLPDRYEMADRVRAYEVRHWRKAFGRRPRLFQAPVDTTFALYRPLTAGFAFALGPAIRTGAPYLARHMPWYADSAHPTDEERYYRAHASSGMSHWNLAADDDGAGHDAALPWTARDALHWRMHAWFRMPRRS